MSKPLWTFLLILTGAFTIWRAAIGVIAYWGYQSLSTSVPGQIQKIQVVPHRSKYALQATYAYRYQGKSYTEIRLLKKPYYLNRASAESAAQSLSEMDWQIYLDPKNPKFSTLDSSFPFKEIFYGLCLLGIFVYFIYLRIHLELLNKEL